MKISIRYTYMSDIPLDGFQKHGRSGNTRNKCDFESDITVTHHDAHRAQDSTQSRFEVDNPLQSISFTGGNRERTMQIGVNQFEWFCRTQRRRWEWVGVHFTSKARLANNVWLVR